MSAVILSLHVSFLALSFSNPLDSSLASFLLFFLAPILHHLSEYYLLLHITMYTSLPSFFPSFCSPQNFTYPSICLFTILDIMFPTLLSCPSPALPLYSPPHRTYSYLSPPSFKHSSLLCSSFLPFSVYKGVLQARH